MGIKIKILNLLYPAQSKCPICSYKAKDVLCDLCKASIPFINGVTCLKCGKELSESYEKLICPDCENVKHSFDIGFSCFNYQDMGKEIIHKLKYEGKREIALYLAKLMYIKAREEKLKVDAIVPVPIHENKLKSRGFNQSELIASEVSRLLGIPLWDCLIRIRDTKDQYNLNREERILNVYNAFYVKEIYNKYRNILLIDDIYTTGSTADECSKVLKAAGAEKVYVITAATGSNT